MRVALVPAFCRMLEFGLDFLNWAYFLKLFTVTLNLNVFASEANSQNFCHPNATTMKFHCYYTLIYMFTTYIN